MKTIIVIALIIALLLTIMIVKVAYGQEPFCPGCGTKTATVVITTEVPATQTEVPATQTEVPATQTEVPATQTEVPATQTEVATWTSWPTITATVQVTEQPGQTVNKPQARALPSTGLRQVSDPEPTFLQQVLAKTAANFICGAIVLAIFAIYLIGTAIKR